MRSHWVNNRAIESLVQFCAEQNGAFDSAAWIDECPADRRVVAVVAAYLSMTSWYGHEEELERIALGLNASILSFSWFCSEAQAIGLDLKTFSATLRHRIAVRQVGGQKRASSLPGSSSAAPDAPKRFV
jgi:hypothetical protein